MRTHVPAHRACADEAHTPRAQGKMCDQSALEPYKLGGGKQVTAVYEYWSKKRSKLGKALIRRMQPPTPASHFLKNKLTFFTYFDYWRVNLLLLFCFLYSF
jgi:hypothetical protein